MDAKSGASLKLTVLNPEGRIWTMVAGGGASVIYRYVTQPATLLGTLPMAPDLHFWSVLALARLFELYLFVCMICARIL